MRISALLPVLSDRGGVWIGWSGTAESDGDFAQAVAEVYGYHVTREQSALWMDGVITTVDEMHRRAARH